MLRSFHGLELREGISNGLKVNTVCCVFRTTTLLPTYVV